MSYLKINGTDVSHLVKNMRVGYETLVADNSGRNANGDTVLDVVNRKIKVYVTFIPMDGGDMASLLSAVSNYVISITFRDSRTNALKTITCYTGTPEPDYYWIHDDKVFYKEMNLNFIEM
jgi:hypothetical protein